MVAEVLFAGGRLDSIVPIGVVVESTSAGSFDSSYADASLSIGSNVGIGFEIGLFTESSNVLSAATVVTGETFWHHFEFYHGGASTNTGNAVFYVYDSSGYPWLRFLFPSSKTLQVQYNSGTGGSPTWTNVGSTWVFSSTTRYAVDLKLTLGSPHSFELSVNGTLQLSGTFTQASFTNIATVEHYGYSNSSTTYWSQFLCTRDISTINAKVKYSRATAAGTNTGWSGAYTDVNEAVNSDNSLEYSTSAGQKTTHAMGDVTVPSGFEIKSVFHWLRAKNDGTSPTNVKSVLRSSGADYSTGNLSGIGTSFNSVGARYNSDPATSSNWTQSGWNAVEAGFESAA